MIENHFTIVLLYPSGFRANHSSYTYLFCLKDVILNGAENGKHTAMILTNPEKAFDILNHKNVIRQNEVYRFFQIKQ